MEFDWTVLIIVVSFVFVGGFIDAIAGGGGIINMIAFMLCGVPMHYALGTNKFQSFFGTLTATINYVRNGHYKKEFVIFSVVGSLVGSLCGAALASMISQNTLKIMMTIILPIVAVIILTKVKPKKNLLAASILKIYVVTLCIGLLIGFYDGLMGPGTGTFLIIAFSMCGLSLLTSNGNAKIVNLGSNIASSIYWIFAGKILFWLAIPCIIANVIANYIGSRLAIKNGDKLVRPIIIVVLIMLFIKTIYDII